jgi:hypothetical protein
MAARKGFRAENFFPRLNPLPLCERFEGRAPAALIGAPKPGAGREKADTGFSRKCRSKLYESITSHEFGLTQSRLIVIQGAAR